LWLDSEGVITPLYPWNVETSINRDHQNLATRPPVLAPQQVVHSPGKKGTGWRVGGKKGVDTLFLLARGTPLPAQVSLAQVIGELSPVTRDLNRWAMGRGAEADQVAGHVNLGSHRGPEEVAAAIHNPLEQLKGRLEEHFEVIQAVWFPHEEK